VCKHWSAAFCENLSANQLALKLLQQALAEVCDETPYRLKKIKYGILPDLPGQAITIHCVLTLDRHFNTPFSFTCSLRLNILGQWESTPAPRLPCDLERIIKRVIHGSGHSVPVRAFRPAMQS
jgi:hypothetical protein